jgi:hypothetical protein
MVVRLLYQQSYGVGNDEGDFAYYNPQRPDIVLMIERGGETFTYLFDAKYRIDERDGKDASPAEPINDMHRYRDAILYRSQDGERKLSRQVVGAYVLYPGRPLPDSYNYQKLIDNENIGAIPLLPGEAGGKALKDFIKTILDKKTPQSHLATDIPTRGTSVVIGAAFSEAEIVDSAELSESSLRNVIKTLRCPVPKANIETGVSYQQIRVVRPAHADIIFEIDKSVKPYEAEESCYSCFALGRSEKFLIYCIKGSSVVIAGVNSASRARISLGLK